MIGGPLPACSYAMVVPSADVIVATIPPGVLTVVLVV
jgi:hypothetical protein